jgi:hypothetical protein
VVCETVMRVGQETGQSMNVDAAVEGHPGLRPSFPREMVADRRNICVLLTD